MSSLRRSGNWFFTKVVQAFYGGRYSDLCYGYNAFWKRVLPDLALDGDGFEIETMMNVRALKAGLKVVEVPSFEKLRIHGESHLRTFPDGWRVLKAIGRELKFGPRVATPAVQVRETPRLADDILVSAGFPQIKRDVATMPAEILSSPAYQMNRIEQFDSGLTMDRLDRTPR